MRRLRLYYLYSIPKTLIPKLKKKSIKLFITTLRYLVIFR